MIQCINLKSEITKMFSETTNTLRESSLKANNKIAVIVC